MSDPEPLHAGVDEIADHVYRISTFVPDIGPTGFTFNQFLIDAEEPMLYHTGQHFLFPTVRAAVERVMPVDRLRWISFAHLEADECGAVNDFLTVAPRAEVVHSAMGVMLSLNDYCIRPPRALADGETLDLGGAELARSVAEIATPHVPHNWESHMLFERVTGTLFCGDVMTQLGNGPALTRSDLVEQATAAEEAFRGTSLGPAVPQTLRRVAGLGPVTLAVMHGSSFTGDCAAQLNSLADVYEQRFGCAAAPAVQPVQRSPLAAQTVPAGGLQ